MRRSRMPSTASASVFDIPPISTEFAMTHANIHLALPDDDSFAYLY